MADEQRRIRRRERSSVYEVKPASKEDGYTLRGSSDLHSEYFLYTARPLYDGIDSQLAALMETPPHGEPQRANDELLWLRDILQDAVDALPHYERWVFDRVVSERMSFRALEAATGVSKSALHRARDRAVKMLRQALWADERIRNHFNVS